MSGLYHQDRHLLCYVKTASSRPTLLVSCWDCIAKIHLLIILHRTRADFACLFVFPGQFNLAWSHGDLYMPFSTEGTDLGYYFWPLYPSLSFSPSSTSGHTILPCPSLRHLLLITPSFPVSAKSLSSLPLGQLPQLSPCPPFNLDTPSFKSLFSLPPHSQV